MSIDRHQAATDTVAHMKRALAFAEAWAEGKFKTVGSKEAWDYGWEATGDTAKVYRLECGETAIWDETGNTIEFLGQEGLAWLINPMTGELTIQ